MPHSTGWYPNTGDQIRDTQLDMVFCGLRMDSQMWPGHSTNWKDCLFLAQLANLQLSAYEPVVSWKVGIAFWLFACYFLVGLLSERPLSEQP